MRMGSGRNIGSDALMQAAPTIATHKHGGSASSTAAKGPVLLQSATPTYKHEGYASSMVPMGPVLLKAAPPTQ